MQPKDQTFINYKTQKKPPRFKEHFLHLMPESLSTGSLPCLSFVGYELQGNFAIDDMFLRRGLCINLLFTDDALAHLNGYIISHRVLKTHMHCMIILGICRGLVFGVQYLENELWDHFSLKRQLLRKIIETTGLDSLLCWNRMNGIAGFSKMGQPPYCENNKSFLTGLLR